MRHRGIRTLWALVTIVPACVGLLSFTVPFATTLRVTDATQLHLAARSGCGRVIWMSASYNASYPERTPLDDYAAAWSQVGPRYLAWTRNRHLLGDGTALSDMGFTISLFAPLGIAVVVWLFFGSLARARNSFVALLTVCGLAILFLSVGIILFSEHTFQLTSCFPGPEPWLHVWKRDPLTVWVSRCELTASWDIPPGRELKSPVYWSQNLGFAGSIRFGAYQVATLTIPWITTGAVLLAYPLFVLVRGLRRHKRNRRVGLCLRCGYNLTGNISGVCPECGTAVARPAPAAKPSGPTT